MTERLVIDSQNELQEISDREIPEYPAAIRIPAVILSYVFHPVFIPVYLAAFMVYLVPQLFAGFGPWEKKLVVIQAFISLCFFPIVIVLLLKALRFINSIRLLTRKDRIIPLIATFSLGYFWLWYVWRNLPDYPQEAVQFAFAVFLAGVFAFLANIYIKVSLHAVSLGMMVTFVLSLALKQEQSFGLYISVALLIAGVVCTARLIVSDHSQKEIYLGLFLGVIAQVAANYFA